MDNLSVYILTRNSEQYLEEILQKICSVADEIIVLDSGSDDKTREIAQKFNNVQFLFREFDNFKNQRNYAAQLCKYNYVLFLDSDEIPDELFISNIQKIKQRGFIGDAYDVARKWYAFGKKIHAIYPITSPDYPVRLFNKQFVSFKNSNFVHETLSGYRTKTTIEGFILHKTFHNKEELDQKLEHYTTLAAEDLIRNQKRINYLKIVTNPIVAFIKWYIIKRGYKDGRTGFVLGKYAYNYTKNKYKKAKKTKLQAR